jgi:pimeloyl-ACP methyl ester carboxylesterase
MNASTAPVRDEKSTTVRTATRPRSPKDNAARWALKAVRGGMGVLSRVSPSSAAAVAERLFLSPRRYRRPAAERELLASAVPRRLHTEHGELAAWEWGNPSNEGAPRVLLVHGWEGRGAQLGPLVEPLLADDFRVFAFDAPAHGDSPGERSSLFHFADAVTRAVKVFGPFHAIVTHSMGGASTLWASRNGPLASRLVMVAPPIDLRDFTRALSRALGLPEEVRGRVHQRLGKRFGVPIENVRAERLAATMRGPLLIVHDEDDRDVPIACGEAIARAWPGAELYRTHGLGHRRILHDASMLRTVVQFVAQGPTDHGELVTLPQARLG